jgi:hypothetical protein
MCCAFTTLVLLGPRALAILWALVDPQRWELAFDSFIWPLLGVIFVPWMTLAYVLVAPDGITALEWGLIIIALIADIASWGGGGFRHRERLSSYAAYEE